MAFRYIGKGTTGVDGKAHLTEDASGQSISPAGYLGTGAGLVDIVASVDNPISAGSIQSTPYEVIDATIMDKGLDGTGNHNDSLWNNVTYFTRGNDGTLVYHQNSGSSAVEVCRFNVKYSIPYCVEMELVECTFARFRVATYHNNTATLYGTIDLQSTGKLQILITSTKVTYKMNGETVKTEDIPSESEEFYFVIRTLAGETQNFKFKDICAYLI